MGFRALWVKETPEGNFQRSIIERNIDDLPAGDVLVRVQYSSLNYKDALSATGNKGITKKYPHTPGIDAAGVVELSRDPRFAAGDEVVVTGHDLGMNTCGGFAQFIRVPGSWVIAKPTNYSVKESMIIGTAGFTAGVALYKMERMGLSPDQGPVVVTGASGGVGSMAVALLANAGYEVIAVTGKVNVGEYLHYLGAKRIESREFVNDQSGKSLLKPQWAGAIDTVGGNVLNTLLKGSRTEGCVVSTGLVGSPKLDTTVYPFILNGVSLIGVGSAETPADIRLRVWDNLNTKWNLKSKLNAIGKEVSIQQLNDVYFDHILAGNTTGRIVVNTNA